MTAYADCVERVKVQDQRQIKKLYESYQAAEAVAELAITNAITTGDSSRLANVSAALNAAKIPLLQYLARFTRPPPSTINSQPSTPK